MRIPFFTRSPEEPEAPGFPVDGTLLREDLSGSDLFNSQVSSFWSSLSGGGFSPSLIDNVWAANRCIQLNSQQIAAMPLRFFGAYEPAWVGSPDPVWFPNGIGDAVFAAVRSMYGWGDAFLYVTSRYANGFPSGWTVLDPETINVKSVDGEREYRTRNTPLRADDVVQISRNPTGAIRGSSALKAFSASMLSSIASSDLSRSINEGGIPNAVLKSQRKLTADQAVALQEQWVGRASIRRGAPAVLPPDIDFQTLAFSPADLMLLDLQQFDARVIAAAFGVPPFLLNLPLEGGLTYQNPAQMFEAWWRTELRPAAGRISAALTANMLPRGSWVEFDARDILAPDFAELVAAWEKIVTFGGATVDEFRASVLRLPPQPLDQSIADQLVPPVAATSGDTGGDQTVVPLRPNTEVST
jgi:HK97 family phage portal protein